MKPEEIVAQTIETIRAAKSVELRMAEHPEQVVSLEEVADIVDEVLEEARQALTEALDSEEQDEASERERWWGEPEPGPYDQFKGGLTEKGYLPRVPTASSWSWWTGCPEKPE